MVPWIASAVAVVIAYLLGSIPTAYLAGQLLRGIDIREYGSRSVGATNTLRVLGKGPAFIVFLIDVLKGTAAVLLTGAVLLPSEQLSLAVWISSLAGMAAILAAITAAALVVALDNPLPVRMLVIVGAVYVVARHHANIKRLAAGTEPRLGRT